MFKWKIFINDVLYDSGTSKDLDQESADGAAMLGQKPVFVKSEKEVRFCLEGRMASYFMQKGLSDKDYLYLKASSKTNFSMTGGFLLILFLEFMDKVRFEIEEEVVLA